MPPLTKSVVKFIGWFAIAGAAAYLVDLAGDGIAGIMCGVACVLALAAWFGRPK